VAQGVIRRLGVSAGPMHGVHQPARRDAQPILLLKQRGHIGERQAELFIEDDRRRDGLRPDLRRGRPERI